MELQDLIAHTGKAMKSLGASGLCIGSILQSEAQNKRLQACDLRPREREDACTKAEYASIVTPCSQNCLAGPGRTLAFCCLFWVVVIHLYIYI